MTRYAEEKRPETAGSAFDTPRIRRFEAFRNVYRDGFRGRFFGNYIQSTAHLERVEVLKGPASVLYGRMEPGGLINQVSKQPLATPYYSLQQQFGSFDLYRTTLDAHQDIERERGFAIHTDRSPSFS